MTTFQAVQAPFQVDSDALLDRDALSGNLPAKATATGNLTLFP